MIACFYLPAVGIACELARVPYYRDQPLVLASGKTITAVSALAVSGGVAAGMTITGARSLCRELVVLPYQREIYLEAAESVWDVIASESSVVEPVSPELCFALFDRSVSFERFEFLAKLLAQRMQIVIHIGIGTSKLVAEQAAKKTRREPIVQVEVGMEAVFLASVPIAELKMIEPAVRVNIERLGIRTLGDILRLPSSSLNYQFRGVAEKLRKLAVGDDYDQVKALWPPAKIKQEFVLDDETDNAPLLYAALASCTETIAKQLLAQQIYCRKLSLDVTFCDNTTEHAVERLRAATRTTADLLAGSLRLLKRLAIDRPVAILGLEVSGLGAGSGAQLTLLPDSENSHAEQMNRVGEVMEFLRQKFGISAVVLASLLAATRQINLWTYPLGRRKQEDVMVATNQKKEPVRFYRRRPLGSKCYEVQSLQDHWQEASWSWDRVLETQCYRVVTDPNGLYQLEKLGVEWKLTASTD
jgi:DNA polymerase-4